MAKSVNEYYSEKMKKLLEMQKNESVPALPPKASGNQATQPDGGRQYYDRFRSRVGEGRADDARASDRPRKKGAGSSAERTVIDDIREGRAPKRAGAGGGPRGGHAPSAKASGRRPYENGSSGTRVAPEQSAEDKFAESVKQIEAMQMAKRARALRKFRDVAVSAALIVAVFVVMCVVVYRLLFVISDIKADGSATYTSEELVIASGIAKGDHLYSFSSREIGELMILRCPEICEVDVERTPPGKVVFNIKEEPCSFYADFYGEYRCLSSGLRVLDSVTEEDAKSRGCVKLVLPDVKNATAGLEPEFAEVRDEGYIYDSCESLLGSKLAQRAGTMDLSDKYNITLTVDGRYIIKLGNSESLDMKLKIANAVLEDEMFHKDIKATIDVTDLSETSVVVDEGLRIE
ncbi:MAG: hypothetical protein IJD22_03370 [Clostridia bacterium]|nr:hypothetical protein [Clostridia bacterium]